jgi:hypothetical protein
VNALHSETAALRARVRRRRAFRRRGVVPEGREAPIWPRMATMIEPSCLMAISVSGAWPSAMRGFTAATRGHRAVVDRGRPAPRYCLGTVASVPMPSTGKARQPAFPRLPAYRTCWGHAKIDANDPERTSRCIETRAGVGAKKSARLLFATLFRFASREATVRSYFICAAMKASTRFWASSAAFTSKTMWCPRKSIGSPLGEANAWNTPG